jgi:hypothetical protein
MAILETVKGTVNTAVDTIATVAQTMVEKNRTNAKLNRLRLIMKNESELMNRAYIELGKHYYEMQKSGDFTPAANQKKLFEVIESSKAKIAKARECYRKIVDSQNDIFYGQATAEDTAKISSEALVDITVACSNENEYDSSPFEDIAVKPAVEEITKEISEEIAEAASEEPSKEQAPAVDFSEEPETPAEDTEATDDELF